MQRNPEGKRYGLVSVMVLLAVALVATLLLVNSSSAAKRTGNAPDRGRTLAANVDAGPADVGVPGQVVVHSVSQPVPPMPEASEGSLLAYSNTESDVVIAPGAFFDIADDIFLNELCGCDLQSFSFTVSGGGDGTGPGFNVSFALYDDCPGSGGEVIPGTAGNEQFVDDGIHVITRNYNGPPLNVGPELWLNVQFDTASAGWLGGAPPSVGFSEDLYHFPFFPCTAQLGAQLYSSFAAQVVCEPLQLPIVDNPNPPDAATNIDPNVVLSWNDQQLATSYVGSNPSVELVTPENFESGYRRSDEVLAELEQAIATGEIPDPATTPQPTSFAPRTYFGPEETNVAGFSVPPVGPNDIFLFEDTDSTLASPFGSGQLFSMMSDASNEVIAAHGDNFDFVAFWLNYSPDPSSQIGAAFYLGLENDVEGIGDGIYQNRASFGVVGDHVEGWVMMWNQASWPLGQFTFTQLVLGQEFEHRFAMFLLPMAGNRALQGNNGSCGRSAHWNFRVDGQGSGMEIAEWTGQSPATRVGGTLNFNVDIPGSVFSYPDLYLMGYVSPGEMDANASELRYLDDNTNCSSPYNGPISTWGSADIVATNGTRLPSFATAQKHFSTAWVMFHLPGSPPTSNQIENVVSILNTWNDMWITSTLNRGTMTNVLNPGDGPQICSTEYEVFLDEFSPPTSSVCTTVDDTMCDPGALLPNTTYFWQVSASDNVGATDGPIWSFTTGDVFTDCNNNQVDDATDIAMGTSLDCNTNGVPDECEADADGDTVPDECDVCPGGDDLVDTDGDFVPDDCDNCELANPEQIDCQPNGIGDVCDIQIGGSLDENGDNVPDECQGLVLPPLPEASGTCTNDADCRNGVPNADVDCISPFVQFGGSPVCYVAKNRYVSLEPNPEQQIATARRVSLDTGGGTTVLGFVGQPVETNVVAEDPVLVAQIEDDPFFADWSTVQTSLGATTVHVGDCQVSPAHVYLIQSIAQGEDIGNESSYSGPLSLRTVDLWGDVSGPNNVANGVRNLLDVQNIVLGFQGAQLDPMIQLELDGTGSPANVPNVAVVNLADAQRALQGFQGGNYPYAAPLDCP